MNNTLRTVSTGDVISDFVGWCHWASPGKAPPLSDPNSLGQLRASQGQKDYNCECRHLTPGADLKCVSNDSEFTSIKICFKLATQGKYEILNILVVENVCAPVTSSDPRSSADHSLRHEDHDPGRRLQPEGLRILPVSARDR